MKMPKPGDILTDRSTLTLREGGEDGRAILVDRWGVLYVPDENNQLQYVGTNTLSAEVQFLFPQFELED